MAESPVPVEDVTFANPLSFEEENIGGPVGKKDKKTKEELKMLEFHAKKSGAVAEVTADGKLAVRSPKGPLSEKDAATLAAKAEQLSKAKTLNSFADTNIFGSTAEVLRNACA